MLDRFDHPARLSEALKLTRISLTERVTRWERLELQGALTVPQRKALGKCRGFLKSCDGYLALAISTNVTSTVASDILGWLHQVWSKRYLKPRRKYSSFLSAGLADDIDDRPGETPSRPLSGRNHVARPGLVFRGAGDVIRRHRAERNWTLAELAAKADLDKGQIAKFEANQVGLTDEKLKSLADAFGMAADALSLECLKAVRPELFTTRIGQLFESMSGAKKPRSISKKRPAAMAIK